MTVKAPSSNPFNHLLDAESQQKKKQGEETTKQKPEGKLGNGPRKSVRRKLGNYVNPFDGQALTKESIELMSFEERNSVKGRVTADIPNEWREELYKMAFDLKVGRYELVAYILGSFLGKTHTDD